MDENVDVADAGAVGTLCAGCVSVRVLPLWERGAPATPAALWIWPRATAPQVWVAPSVPPFPGRLPSRVAVMLAKASHHDPSGHQWLPCSVPAPGPELHRDSGTGSKSHHWAWAAI